MELSEDLRFERYCRLVNTTHSEIAPSLSLPSLPPCFGSVDQKIGLSDVLAGSRAGDLPEIIAHAGTISELLSNCDVGYLNLKEDGAVGTDVPDNHSILYQEVMKFNHDAFKCFRPGPSQEWRSSNQTLEKKPIEQKVVKLKRVIETDSDDRSEKNLVNEPPSVTSRKPKMIRKETDSVPLTAGPDTLDQQGIVGNFCEMVEDFCSKAEFPDDLELADEQSLPLAEIKTLVNQIMSIRSKKVLHLVPLDILVRLLGVLDRQIQSAQGVSSDGNDNDNPDVDAANLVLCALESSHAALAIMAHQDMPKQLYREEVIERILDFSRHQIMEIIAACNPLQNLAKPSDNDFFDGEDADDDDINNNSSAKKRRYSRSFNMRKSAGSKISTPVQSVLQKLCTILGFLKDLLSVERLSDSCILQLVKTSFSTFLAENVQLLQLKCINLISGVYASYTQHRSFLIDETLQLLRKLQFSKRAIRTYLLPDEEQKQIQMITALLIQMVQFSSNLPESLKSASNWNVILDTSSDSSTPAKCYEDATKTCCLFWTSFLQRLTNGKSQDASESKIILENLVMDLLTTLNLPEYPASASLLEVLCVLLLENAGLKCKDISARCMAVDFLGAIAAKLKRDAVTSSRDKFWILQQLVDRNESVFNGKNDACSVCLKGRGANIICHICKRCFHSDCLGIAGQEMLLRDWACHICLCKKQLIALHSYCNCKMQNKDNAKQNTGLTSTTSGDTDSATGSEVIQQILLNYMQQNGSEDDVNLFTRWFHLCLWYKDDSQSRENVTYHLARLKSRAILRDSTGSLFLSRDGAKRICLALGQNVSFARGFDKILYLLLVSLRENSPVLRAKALRAVSAIVEADPKVLCYERVQTAVEGRFCDSAISVREAALELVGRHIASHPEVGLKYYEKVAERIKDTGVSVRKRAIKIIRDLCISQSNFPEATQAFIVILSRVTDEESSVQDIVCKTFYELWFEEPTGSQKHLIADGSCVPLDIAKKTEQIVDMLRNMPNNHHLVTIIRRNLTLDFLPQSAKATGINASLASVRKRCELICKRLLERILQVEEETSDKEEGGALPYVLALHSFCVVNPALCVPSTDQSQFVTTLQPYLKNQVENKAASQLLESILFIVNAVLPLLRKPPQSIIEELEQDLKHMIVRHSFLTVVHACIKCLCSLSKIAGKGANVVEYLILVFFKRLQDSSSDNTQALVRSLFCLGLLLRYSSDLEFRMDTQHIHIHKSLLSLKKYLAMEDIVLKVRALQALGNVLIARPEYMLENDVGKILRASLDTTVDPRLKTQALQNLYEYLLDAETKFSSDTENNNAIPHFEGSRNAVPVAAGAGDTNICGGIIQLYWNNILEICLDVDEQIRQTALKILEVVLRQGLVHPITCVPCLIALEIDPLEVNSKLAHHLLMNMNEKYPSFFESRLGDGLQMSFKFVQCIANTHNLISGEKGKLDRNPIAFVRPGISRIYRLIRANRISRNKFIHSIVKKFETGGGNYLPISFLVYCTEILASLPFTCPDEPLYLIYDINRIIQVRAGALEANMKAWSSFLQHQNSVNSATTNENLDLNANSCWQKTPQHSLEMENKMSNSHAISEEDIHKFQADCHEAIALQLLLKLKRHLKITYGLNDARCQAFSLKEPPKAGETISRQNVPFSAGDTQLSLPTSYQAMIQKYQDFKVALREDTIDYSIYSASIKKKRPTPRSSKGGKTANQRRTNQDDDEDDDEDWTGGPRMLDFSNQRSNGVRITRQRVQV